MAGRLRRDLIESSLAEDQTISEALRVPVKYVYEDSTVRQAADHMVNQSIRRLPVVSRESPHRLIGIITRSDILSVFQRRIRESELQTPSIVLFNGRSQGKAKKHPT